MFTSFSDLSAYARDRNIQMLDFKITELSGSWRHVTIPASRLSEELFEEGVGFDGSNYGYTAVETSDMVFIPDYKTAFLDPFWEEPTLSFLGDIYQVSKKGIEPFRNDTRAVLDRALKYIKKTGTADEIILGPEFEYYILDQISFWNETYSAGYNLDSSQASWNSADSDDHYGYQIGLKGGYHKDAPYDRYRNLRSAISRKIEEAGIEVKYHHHEVGGPGQHEIEVKRSEAKSMADAVILSKYIIKNMAVARGLSATFMPKPFYGEAGNGLHVHMQLFKEGKPVFAGPDKNYAGLSDTALYFIGGILEHTPALMAFAAPTVNSYKRLVNGYEAPVAICFASANRSAVLRIPGYATSSADKRFEFRPGDGSANPYLFFASLLMAGIDGVENKIDPVKKGFGPVEENIYELVEKKEKEIRFLPGCLNRALTALKEDKSFLTKESIFTEELLHNWIETKKDEARQLSRYPTPGEFKLYYDV